MKKIFLLAGVFLLIASVGIYATTRDLVTSNIVEISFAEAKEQIIKVELTGIVCEFCARSLEKIFEKESVVKSIEVDLDTRILAVTLNQGETLSEEMLKSLVEAAGYGIAKPKDSFPNSD